MPKRLRPFPPKLLHRLFRLPHRLTQWLQTPLQTLVKRRHYPWIFSLCVGAAIGLGVVLRLHNLGTFPARGDTHDEYAWTFLGASLLTTGQPTSWSYFPYEHVVTAMIQDNPYPLVTPYLDHPPLFGFLPGSVQALSGKVWSQPLPIETLRLSMVALAGINLLLFFLIAHRWFGKKMALLCLLFYATTPSIVFSQRLILAENLLVTWMLLMLWIVTDKQRTQLGKYLLIAVSAGAILTKVAGIVIPLSALWYLLLQKDVRWKQVLWGMGLGAFLLACYVCAYDGQQFLKIQLLQGSLRMSTFLTVAQGFFFQNKIAMTNVFDPMMFVAKLSLVWFFLQEKKPTWFAAVATQAIGQLVFIFLAVGEFTGWAQVPGAAASLYGWYFYPLLTLALLSFSTLLYSLIRSQNRWGLWLLTFLILPTTRLLFWSQEAIGTIPPFSLSKAIHAGVLFFTTPIGWLHQKYWSALTLTWCAIIIGLNIFVTLLYSPEYQQFLNHYLLSIS